jgi:hypothetical protein
VLEVSEQFVFSVGGFRQDDVRFEFSETERWRRMDRDSPSEERYKSRKTRA